MSACHKKTKKKTLAILALNILEPLFSCKDRASFYNCNRQKLTFAFSRLFIQSKLLESHEILVGQIDKGQVHSQTVVRTLECINAISIVKAVYND